MASEFPNPLSIHYILGAIDARPTSYTRQGFIGRKILPEKVVGGLFLCCCVCGATYQAEKLKPYLDPDDPDLKPDYINIT